MEVKTYCNNMRGELISWKAKTYDMARKMDKRSSGPDERTGASISELGAMIDEFEKKIEELETSCPANWDKERADLDGMIAEMNERWGEATQMSPDDF
ncbi:MAG: hypothetical protein WAL98_05445 [Desulfatiglandaceae bacterium]